MDVILKAGAKCNTQIDEVTETEEGRRKKGKRDQKNTALHPHTLNLHVKENTHFNMGEHTINGWFCRWYLVYMHLHTMQTLVSLFFCSTKHNYSIYTEIYLRKK